MLEKSEPKKGEFTLTLVLTLVALFIIVESIRFPSFPKDPTSPGLFTAMSALVILGALAVNWRLVLLNRKHQPQGRPESPGEAAPSKIRLNIELIVIMLSVIAYALLLPVLHFELATGLFVFGVIMYFRETGWLKAALISAGTVAFVVVTFSVVFKIFLP